MQQFIEPKTLARVKDLPLVAKTVAEGFMHGLHLSQQKGTGIEFSQYRVYEPGDELSKIDWKLFARSDRYFVREAERESNINVWLVLDASASMQQKSVISKHDASWNKLDYGRYLLATIAHLGQQQGDAVGLLGLSTDQVNYLPALSGLQQHQRIMLQLARMQSGGVFPSTETFQNNIGEVRRSGLVLIVSDFYQQDDEILELVSSLKNDKTDVVAIQLESSDEAHFPYKGMVRFEDMETKEQRFVSAKSVKSEYLVQRQRFNQELEQFFTKHKVQHLRCNIDEPLDETLYAFLQARAKLL
ncbi:DUF58 domain-containing protein [Alteromonadaceae bacterium M269]|nr:DUF58 domain-containing protein [Alteromonadaceae bacterium M269]